jgi:DNA replication protein DnaC
MDEPIKSIFKRSEEYARLSTEEQEARTKKRQAEFEEWLKTQKISIPCETHKDVLLAADIERARPKDGCTYPFSLKYETCKTCVAEKLEKEVRMVLHQNGVPSNLVHATLDNWSGDQSILSKVREFAKAKKGFLVLIGDYGVGKSHLAVSVVRRYVNYHRYGEDSRIMPCSSGAWFVKQSSLLLELRETYRNPNAKNPIAKAESASLFVLDEIGISGGGKDEAPMIHEILSHRYEELKPTILTSNVSFEQLKESIGDRMRDRLKECAFAILTIGGESQRSKVKQGYFDNLETIKERDNCSACDSAF